MKKSKKQQYTIATTGTVFGIVLFILSTNGGIDNSDRIILVFSALFFIPGVISYFNPGVSEVLGHILKNMSDSSDRTETIQKQKSPKNSPQTGVVQGTQNITYYGGGSETNLTKKLNSNKVKNRLKQIKLDLQDLTNQHYTFGEGTLTELEMEVKGIIHKIYPKGDSAEKRLISKQLFVYTTSSGDQEFQRNYLEHIKDLIRTIEVILREMDLD